MCTRKGTVKRTELEEFKSLRVTGKRAIGLTEGDVLDFVLKTTGEEQILINTRSGYAVKFDENQVRVMGTSAQGVRGVSLSGDDDRVVGMCTASDEEELLVCGLNGYGKRSKAGLFRKTNRGAKGVIAFRVTDKTGPLVAAAKVTDSDELMIITTNGMIIRTRVAQISSLGRATQGVRLINLNEKDTVSSLEVINMDDADDGTGDLFPDGEGESE
jgi:DNA gyrase subunit A